MDGSSQNSGENEIHWDRDPFEGWRETVNGWPWRSLGGGDWEKGGKCPKCNDEMTVEKQGSYTDSVEVERDRLGEIDPEGAKGVLFQIEGVDQHAAYCDCGGEHKGRPPGVSTGCGQWALIDPPPDDD